MNYLVDELRKVEMREVIKLLTDEEEFNILTSNSIRYESMLKTVGIVCATDNKYKVFVLAVKAAILFDYMAAKSEVTKPRGIDIKSGVPELPSYTLHLDDRELHDEDLISYDIILDRVLKEVANNLVSIAKTSAVNLDAIDKEIIEFSKFLLSGGYSMSSVTNAILSNFIEYAEFNPAGRVRRLVDLSSIN